MSNFWQRLWCLHFWGKDWLVYGWPDPMWQYHCLRCGKKKLFRDDPINPVGLL